MKSKRLWEAVETDGRKTKEEGRSTGKRAFWIRGESTIMKKNFFKRKKEKEQQIQMQKQLEIQHSRKIKIFSAVIACLAVCVLILGGTTASAVNQKNLMIGQMEEQTG